MRSFTRKTTVMVVAIVLLSMLGGLQAQAAKPPPDFVLAWGEQGEGDGQFYRPLDVAVDLWGNVYVADQYNHRIQKFDDQGTHLDTWGGTEYGTGDGEFNRPQGVAVDLWGNAVYVADCGNHRIQKFDSEGTHLDTWGSKCILSTNEGCVDPDGAGGPLEVGDGQFNWPNGVAVDLFTDVVYVTDKNNHRVQKFDSEGTFLLKWGEYGGDDGQFYEPTAVAVDLQGDVYVVDQASCRVQKFDSEGNFLLKWGEPGSGDGQFDSPYGVEVDLRGRVFVSEWGSGNRIQVFDRAGNFVVQWGGFGNGDGQFNYPGGMAVDKKGNIYVAGNYNHRVQKFK